MASSAPSRGHRKNADSLGSLYEVLADLDDSQLQYLVREMSHTGHQHIPVSLARSTFEGRPVVAAPAGSGSGAGSGPGDAAAALRRTLSKSQQGRLRLRVALEREPSLRRQAEKPRPIATSVAGAGAGTAAAPAIALPPTRNFTAPPSLPSSGPTDIAPEPLDYHASAHYHHFHLHHHPSSGLGRRNSTAGARSSAAARRLPARVVPRPRFDLPPGVTVSDLLALLRAEFLCADADADTCSHASSISGSPASPAGSLATTPSSSSPQRGLRRHASRLDLALEAERSASGIEVAVLEPRPGDLLGSLGSLGGLGGPGPSVVMEGIFDVLENR